MTVMARQLHPSVVRKIVISAAVWSVVAFWVAGPTESPASDGVDQVIHLDASGQPTAQQDDTPPLPQRMWQGLLVPQRRVTVTAPVSAMLWSVAVEEGQSVERGQVLAEMDHRTAKAAMEVARLRAISDASVRRAAYTLQHATLKLDSIAQAHQAGASTDYELHRATLKRDQSEATYSVEMNKQAVAQAILKLEQQKYAMHIVQAPFAGRVVRMFAQSGDALRVSEPLLTLVDMRTLEVSMRLPVSLYDKLKLGQTYRLTADSPDRRSLVGTLKVVDPMINATDHTFRCVFTVTNDDKSLPAGFVVKLDRRGFDAPASTRSEQPN